MGIISKKTWFSQCFLFVLFLFLNIQFSKESDTLSPGQSLSGNQTLISAGGIFELGFFTPGNSQNYYIGIWYKTLPNQTVVWVANRKEPISDHFSSELKLLEDGNLVLLNQSGAAVWSTNSTSTVHNSTTAKLLDNANFVISNALDSSGVIWQSFDHPTNHWLPGGKLGYKNKTNEEMNLVSWRSPENPAPSLFSLDVARNGTGHSHLLMWNDTHQYWNSGDWTGKIFTFVPELQKNFYVTNMTLVSNENESYFTYTNAIPNAFTRFVLEVTGQLRQYVWQENFGEWKFFWTRPTQQCEVHAFCGPFSVCNQKEEPLCVCMEGFEPKMEEYWKLEDHTDGCVRKAPLQCDGIEKKDRFLVMRSMFFPDNPESLAVGSVEECESACLSNCSCNAFAYDNGCSIWKGDLFNLQQLESGDKTGRNFHIRIAESELIQTSVKHKSVKTVLIVCAAIAGFCILCVLVAVILWRRRPTVLLERVDGRRNREQLESGFEDYFPLRVVKTVQNGEDVLALLDDRLEGNAITEELNEACKVACWCIQDDEKDRPTMGQVVQILEGVTEVSIPPMPGFLQHLTENPAEVVPYQEISSTTES
ncbi:hypothetical protein EZV62_020396 [Acer yangbiense]|uniref:Bulb-type lectin domain-containing protein n=1 Tax=Acer yangbiense TaxID=1000413 RepID=A0A5C7HDQ5_9ROSI|nr:hypothetical protein EZV62_020396 [Acer yangbiense]